METAVIRKGSRRFFYMKRYAHFLVPAALVFILSAFYLPTMAPGLTWANHGSDGGDLISAAYTNGIPHPTGYPVYLVLADLFQALPLGSLAYRTNLLSAIAAMLASLCIYFIVEGATRRMDLIGSWVSGLVAALAFGLSPIVWSQAVITEVYTLHALFVALTIYLLLDPQSHAAWMRRKFILGLVLGLAVGNHLTALLLFSGVAFAVWEPPTAGQTKAMRFNLQARRNTWNIFYILAVGVFLGLIVYGLLPLRASLRPVVNWGDPVTLDGWIWLVSGEMYQGNIVDLSFPLVLEELQTWTQILFAQFGLPGITLSVLGLIWSFRASPLQRMLVFNAAGFSVFWMFYRVVDSYVYLMPVLISIAVWIGLGCSEIFKKIAVAHGDRAVWMIGLMLLAYWTCLFAPDHAQQVDASQDVRAEQFGGYVMNVLPEDAIVFVNGDRSTFALWYFQYGLSQRMDVSIISVGLLPYDWYRNGIRTTYPWLEIPDSSIDPWVTSIQEWNPGLPVCHVYFIGEPLVFCE